MKAVADQDRVLILGARSDIGRAIAREYAAAGHSLILAARRAEELGDDRAELELRYPITAQLVEFDVTDGAAEKFFEQVGTFGTLILVAGLLGDQQRAQSDADHAALILQTNFTGPALYLLAAARRLEQRGSGTIIAIGSVAGDRGRASNFVYGSAKAGLDQLLSGLRNRLFSRGVAVITVKPGFVATRMTEGMKLPPLLTASPGEVARAIRAAQAGAKDIVYVRPLWRWIMLAIRLLPERWFKRTSL